MNIPDAVDLYSFSKKVKTAKSNTIKAVEAIIKLDKKLGKTINNLMNQRFNPNKYSIYLVYFLLVFKQ